MRELLINESKDAIDLIPLTIWLTSLLIPNQPKTTHSEFHQENESETQRQPILTWKTTATWTIILQWSPETEKLGKRLFLGQYEKKNKILQGKNLIKISATKLERIGRYYENASRKWNISKSNLIKEIKEKNMQ